MRPTRRHRREGARRRFDLAVSVPPPTHNAGVGAQPTRMRPTRRHRREGASRRPRLAGVIPPPTHNPGVDAQPTRMRPTRRHRREGASRRPRLAGVIPPPTHNPGVDAQPTRMIPTRRHRKERVLHRLHRCAGHYRQRRNLKRRNQRRHRWGLCGLRHRRGGGRVGRVRVGAGRREQRQASKHEEPSGSVGVLGGWAARRRG